MPKGMHVYVRIYIHVYTNIYFHSTRIVYIENLLKGNTCCYGKILHAYPLFPYSLLPILLPLKALIIYINTYIYVNMRNHVC